MAPTPLRAIVGASDWYWVKDHPQTSHVTRQRYRAALLECGHVYEQPAYNRKVRRVRCHDCGDGYPPLSVSASEYVSEYGLLGQRVGQTPADPPEGGFNP